MPEPCGPTSSAPTAHPAQDLRTWALDQVLDLDQDLGTWVLEEVLDQNVVQVLVQGLAQDQTPGAGSGLDPTPTPNIF